MLLVAVLGSVAFLLWQAQRRHRQPPARDSLIRPPAPAGDAPLQALAPLKSLAPGELGSAMFRETGADPDDVELADVWAIPTYPGVALPGAHRAAIAVHLGRPSELRRIAQEMQSAGKDSEAGLLNNYALLLERSSNSRARVLAEVTRMLQAAAAERRTSAAHARETQRSRAAACASDTVSETPPGAPRPGDGGAAFEAGGATAQAPLVPMPVLAVGEKRRAG